MRYLVNILGIARPMFCLFIFSVYKNSLSVDLNLAVSVAFTGQLKKDLSVLNLPGITVANQITPENISISSAIKNTSKNLDRALMIQMSELLT